MDVPKGRIVFALVIFLLNFFLTFDSVALLHRYREVLCPNRGRSYSVTLVQTLTGLLVMGVPFQELMNDNHCEWQVLGTWFGVQLLAAPLLVQLYRIYNLVLIETDKVDIQQVRQDRRKLTSFMKRSALSSEGFAQICLALLLAVPSIIFVVNLAKSNGNLDCLQITVKNTYAVPLALCGLCIFVAIVGCALLWRRYSVARASVRELVPQLLLVAVCMILAYSVEAGTQSPVALYFLNLMVITWQLCYIFLPVHLNHRQLAREVALAAEIRNIQTRIGSATGEQVATRVIIRTAVPVHTMTEAEFSRALIESPETLAIVLDYLRRKFCVENLIFLQQAWAYEEEPTIEMMEHLYEWFVRVGSPLELNILNVEKTRVRHAVERVRSQVRAHAAATIAHTSPAHPASLTSRIPSFLKAISHRHLHHSHHDKATGTGNPVATSAHSSPVHSRSQTPTQEADSQAHRKKSSKENINTDPGVHEPPTKPGVDGERHKGGGQEPGSSLNPDNSHKLNPEGSVFQPEDTSSMGSDGRTLVDGIPRSSSSSSSSSSGVLIYSNVRQSSISNNPGSNNNSPDRTQFGRILDGGTTLIAIAEDLEHSRSSKSNNNNEGADLVNQRKDLAERKESQSEEGSVGVDMREKSEQIEVKVVKEETVRSVPQLQPDPNANPKTSPNNLDNTPAVDAAPVQLPVKAANVDPDYDAPVAGFAPPPPSPPTPPPELFRVAAFLVLRLIKSNLPKTLTLQVSQRVEVQGPNPTQRKGRKGFMAARLNRYSPKLGDSPRIFRHSPKLGDSPKFGVRGSPKDDRGSPHASLRRGQLHAIPLGPLGVRRSNEKDSGSGSGPSRRSNEPAGALRRSNEPSPLMRQSNESGLRRSNEPGGPLRRSNEKDSGSGPNSARASRQLSVARNLEDRFSARMSQLGLSHRKNQHSIKLNPVEIQAELQDELHAHAQQMMLAHPILVPALLPLEGDEENYQQNPEAEDLDEQDPVAELFTFPVSPVSPTSPTSPASPAPGGDIAAAIAAGPSSSLSPSHSPPSPSPSPPRSLTPSPRLGSKYLVGGTLPQREASLIAVQMTAPPSPHRPGRSLGSSPFVGPNAASIGYRSSVMHQPYNTSLAMSANSKGYVAGAEFDLL